MKLAFIDIDGVLADSSIREAKAHEIAMQRLTDNPRLYTDFVLPMENIVELKKTKGYKTAFFANDVFYSPDLVPLDKLIVGTSKALDVLEQHNYSIFFLTSRPETMRQATLAWLDENDIYVSIRAAMCEYLIMKPSAFQYTKTIVWKTGTIQQYAALFKAEAVLVIDDEQTTLDSVKASDLPCSLMVAISLKEAIELIKTAM